MGFTRIKYTPETGLKNTSSFPDTPVSADAAREQFQRLFDQVKTQVNALMAALESSEPLKSGAQQIGSAPIDGITGSTVFEMLRNLKEQIVFEKIDGGSLPIGSVGTVQIVNNAIKSEKIDAGAVESSQLADNAVTSLKLVDGAVTTSKLGETSRLLLDVEAEEDLTVTDRDRIEFRNGQVKLYLNDCEPVLMAPIVIDTEQSPPDGVFPIGTLYVQYVDVE